MSLDRYQFRAQLGAGPDGIAYRAVADDGPMTEVEIRDLSAARQLTGRWERLVPRLRAAAQLAHPGAIRVLELGLDHDPPFAIMEWVGMTTLSKSPLASATVSRHEALKLVDAVAGALTAAHRLGLSHGLLGPEHVFLAGVGDPKLDFTGLDVGFPLVLGSLAPFSQDANEARDPAASRAADLHGLGQLLAWLLASPAKRGNPNQVLSGIDGSTPLGRLINDLLADDPAERPSAREAHEQLSQLLLPMDATGLAAPPIMKLAQPGGPGMESGDRSRNGPSFGAETMVVEAGSSYLGRYRLMDKLGEGAQGIVHRARDSADGSMVAIKILRSDRTANPEVLRRFRKEARMLAEVNNPHVVNLLEFNEDDGVPYMVLELVAGESLDHLLRRHTRLDEKQALAIMASIARGLMEAHERGIVHRDIKPSNVLLVEPERDHPLPAMTETLDRGDERPPRPRLLGNTVGNRTLTAATVLATPGDPGTATRVKISDFGLARHVVDSESLALTAAGALMGTPHYMAPELWTGRAVDPRTDVYAMGATFFHLLTGQPPFLADSREELCALHCHDPVPRAASLSPDVSDGAQRLIDRALCKRPEDRYFDAGAVLRDIEALLHGRPSDLAIHPRLPDCDTSQVLAFEFRWELEASPRELWPLVTNTDRLDRAIGFPPVTYKTRYEPGRGVRTFAVGKKAGMVEAGEEHPYEWVEPRRMGVLREYSEGPFRWLVSVVELIPRSAGGTTLIHGLRLEPSSWKIRLGSRWGVGVSMRKSLERVYRRIDATLNHQRSRGIVAPGVDPFEAAEPMPTARRQRLERLLDRLIEHGIDASAVDRLGEFLAGAPPQEVARIRPLALAERWEVDPDALVRACLHAAHDGLLELHWDLLCPICRISCQVTDTLRAIAEHAHCEACHLDFQLDFANSIELIFRVHPEIRVADLGTYCVGGPAHSPHVLAQIRVAPDERMELELELQAGSYRLRGPQLPWAIDFHVERSALMRRWDVDLGIAAPPTVVPALRTGSQVVILTNPYPRELVIRIERSATRHDALTAAKAASMALFRELFPSEILAPGQLATVSMVTLMVTGLDPEQADALYNELGDARAFGVIHEHIQSLGEQIRDGGGAVVKTMGEGVLASFNDVEAAVRTALDIVARLESETRMPQLRPRLGIHRGTTLAATLNDHLDYFGSTARQAVATLDFAREGDLVLTQAVAADPGVATLLNSRNMSGEVIPLKGAEMPHLIRIRSDTATALRP